jgi:hypothetical protein
MLVMTYRLQYFILEKIELDCTIIDLIYMKIGNLGIEQR